MEEKQPTAWTSVTHYLKTAALLPQQRDELISRALQQLLTSIPAAGTALIWPCQNGIVPWKVYYAGIRRTAMHRWLSARLDPSMDVMFGMLQHDLTCSLPDMPPPLLMRLHTLPSSASGLWIIWSDASSTSFLPGPDFECIERVRQTLEAVLEVEDREEQYFSNSSPLHDRELIEALAHGDAHALSAFLSLTRVVAKADFTFWGRAYQDVVEITSHLGAKHSGFGFALARGHGVGGRVADYGTIVLGDYRNSPYRDPSVSDIVDGEQVRSGMALPVRYNSARDKGAHVAAVLYATRRTVTHFSLAECLLVQRLAHLLEPLPLEIRASSFFLPGLQHIPDHKAAWYDIVLHANRIEVVEAWASQFIRGTVIITDGNGRPYVFSHTEQLEQVKASRSSQPERVQVLSLAAPGVHLSGQVYLCSSIPLPPPQWPDFLADLGVACNLVIARMEQAQDQLGRQREQWLRALLKGKSSQYIEQDGYRLGLPVEHGQLWVLAWPPETMQPRKSARKRMIAESVVLDSLKSPLIFFDDDMAVVLLEEQAPQPPSKVRDALLKHCGPQPLWIVHGARYRSLHELKMTLTHTISLAQKARREEYGEYLLDIFTFGLDSLLENPRLAEDLDAFATKLLTPLIEYDDASGSHLTETFVLAQTLGSAQAAADQLAMHVNTIRYRLHRVKDILGTDQASPKENAALTLAAFIWKRFHTLEQTPLADTR
ncbi:MAG TPA: helix-turn-helix domain-containing protein [Ktedonobacteraceae bacterium]|nr:helix-turn-helix domain-containing protein [Ktedonobacteraceae bacterium]